MAAALDGGLVFSAGMRDGSDFAGFVMPGSLACTRRDDKP